MLSRRWLFRALSGLFGAAAVSTVFAPPASAVQPQWKVDGLCGTTGNDIAAIKARSSDPILRERLLLVQHGIPFDVAFSLPNDERVAWMIALGENSGMRFDWIRLGFWETRAPQAVLDGRRIAECVRFHLTEKV